MKLSDFDYELPEERIALRPVDPRSSSRMIVDDGDGLQVARTIDLPGFLRPGDMLVFNDTRVLPARLSGRRLRGDVSAKVEVTLVKEHDTVWQVMARPARKLMPGDRLEFGGSLTGEVVTTPADGLCDVAFDQTGSGFLEALAEAGAMPLPPYIAGKRPADEADLTDYQSIFARRDGAIAAPTASLHFDDALIAALDERGVKSTFVTLHVGIGTFLPVKVDDISDHRMHAECGEVSDHAARAITAGRAAGGRIIAVGTTALRLLETAGADGTMRAWQGETDIFIRPGYRFQAIDGLITNFHLPKSTLLMLVAALIGRDRMFEIYDRALAENFRFFSYGDCSLLFASAGHGAKAT